MSVRLLLREFVIAKPQRPFALGLRDFSTRNCLSHAHHDHSHGEEEESILFAETLKKNPRSEEVRLTWLGLYSNVALAIGKGLGGILFHSNVLMADAAHQLGDTLSDIVTLFSLRFCRKKPTKRFPLGFGKFEMLGSLGVSGMLLGTASIIALSSVNNLYAQLSTNPVVTENLHLLTDAHSHSHTASVMTHPVLTVSLAFASVVVKEWLFQKTSKLAKKTESNVLAANAWHHRADAMTSVVALITLVGTQICHAPWLDPAAGCLVSLFVFKAGLASTKNATARLLDCAPSEVVQGKVRSCVQAYDKFPCTVLAVTGNAYGVHVSVNVPSNIDFTEACQTADQLRQNILSAIPTLVACQVTPLVEGCKQYEHWKDVFPPEEEHSHHH